MFKASSRKSVIRSLAARSHLNVSAAAFSTGKTPLVVKNGIIVNAGGEFHGDVHIADGKITAVTGPNELKAAKKAEIIDAEGKYIIPGGIDPHVHLEMPFMGTVSIDDYNYGTRAGLAGGTTTLIDYVIPNPGQSLVEAYEAWSSRAIPKVNSDYSFHCCITYWADTIPGDMEILVNKYGITSFKIFLAYKDLFQVNDTEVLKIMETAKKLGAMTLVHAENGDCVVTGQQRMNELGIFGPEGHSMSRNDELEAEATHRAITLAQHVNAPVYIVHVMSKLAADEVARGRRKGFVVFGEPIASGLGVDGSRMWAHDWRYAAGHVMSPPLSPDPTTKEDLMKRLAAGELQLVATDNCTFNTEQKMMGRENFTKIPNGVNGIEDRLSIVWNNGVMKGYLTPSDFVRVTSTQAAQIFNMYPRKGVIQAGSDADLVIWNGDDTRTISAKTHHHAVDFNIFEGMEVFGIPEVTISAGEVKWRDGELNCEQGSGNFIARSPFGYAYQKINRLDNHKDPRKRMTQRDATQEPTEEKYRKEKARADVLAAEVERLEKTQGSAPKSEIPDIKIWTKDKSELYNVENALKAYLPNDVLDEVWRILYGSQMQGLDLGTEAHSIAADNDFELDGYKMPCETEQSRESRVVRVAAIQNQIVVPTDLSVAEQKQALFDRIEKFIDASAAAGANVACLQECWTAPFFFCTRERYPWIEFAEDTRDGESTVFLSALAKKYNMVIVSPILEKDEKSGILHNTAVIIDNHGAYVGRHRKNHIPRVGDFNESSYYMEGNTGHPVFDTEFGKLAVNICYGRHHPLNWMAFGLNQAEIVFNPSATVGALSEPLWGIEARNAAIANHYYTVGINRIGSEEFPREFTSGDGKPAHNTFGHFYGSSYVAGPNGHRTPGLSRVKDGVLIAELDLNLCDQTKQKWQFNMTARWGLYADTLRKYAYEDYKHQIITNKKN